MNYLVIKTHRSEYPDPITFERGESLSVGERYEGPEGWDDWFFCTNARQVGGWVPGQLIQWVDDTTALALEDYSAHELDVEQGESLTGLRQLNAWVWCVRRSTLEQGWVPLLNLRRDSSRRP
ncbi:SH3 domain-containing protein [Pseudomonas sp. 21LCFQ010]|uniref:SH3 domain-containing protein n=1 Tax=Pseudomonas sp. 21LCFQ010 TaxID=2957506 RepID=UPI00209824E9|nr:SH3 domain-containing protein [Pseudomonas sp. 21LCFQ010]MCO8162206.1 SH3 domain-containing protein [Pseudomonas sp. 21LCFQ010]